MSMLEKASTILASVNKKVMRGVTSDCFARGDYEPTYCQGMDKGGQLLEAVLVDSANVAGVDSASDG